MSIAILKTTVRSEHDVLHVRQRARQVALLLGFDAQDQTRIATAVSEIARNVVQHAVDGRVEFRLSQGRPQIMEAEVRDSGPGIADLDAILSLKCDRRDAVGASMRGVRGLMDSFEVESSSETGTRVTLGKARPRSLPACSAKDVSRIVGEIAKLSEDDPLVEMRLQNQELLRALDELRTRHEERDRLLLQADADRVRLGTLMEQMPAGVFLAEAATGSVLFANREAKRICGIEHGPREASITWAETKLYRLDGAAVLPHENPLTRAIVEGETSRDELVEIERQDGSRTTVLINASPVLDEHGAIVSGLVAFHDITERMLHLREIESLNGRLRRSIQETHHRVKNNLQIISALVDLQTESVADTVPTEALVRIGRHTRSLAALHDLLTQAATAETTTDSLSTEAAMAKLMPLLCATTGGRNILYRGDDFQISVREGASLALLVSEVVSNAAKHGRGEISLTLTARNDTARLEVCDDGPGFPADFDPRLAANTGLALIDSAGRYDLGGIIRYENRPEGGARVVVEFPMPTTCFPADLNREA